MGILGNDWVGPFPFEIEGIEYEAYGLKNRIAGSQRLFLSDLGIYDGRDTGSFMRVFAYSAVLLLAMLAIGYGVCRTRNSITGMLASIKGWGKVFPVGLIHRWTFNKTLADDVCGKDAVPLGRSGVKWNDGKSAVILEGGQAGTSGLDLGENLIGMSRSFALCISILGIRMTTMDIPTCLEGLTMPLRSTMKCESGIEYCPMAS